MAKNLVEIKNAHFWLVDELFSRRVACIINVSPWLCLADPETDFRRYEAAIQPHRHQDAVFLVRTMQKASGIDEGEAHTRWIYATEGSAAHAYSKGVGFPPSH